MTPISGHEPIAYSIAEACRVSSLGRTFMFAAIKEGSIVTKKVGRRRLIMADSLRSFIAAMEVE